MYYHFAILKNETNRDHLLWIKAIEELNEDHNYSVIDITKSDWLNKCTEIKYDIFLTRPSSKSSLIRQLYDERIYILNQILRLQIYPSLAEIFVYENKRYLSYWLKANKIPHAYTDVFYNKDEALRFVESTSYPIVAKLNFGAGGSGVKILKNRADAALYTDQMFSFRGHSRGGGPKLLKGNILKKVKKIFQEKNFVRNRLKEYKMDSTDRQLGFVLFQKYVEHSFEWRCVRIGDSYFAHKKMKMKDKASGTLVKGYDNPPLELFNFIKKITDKHNLTSVSIDLFETKNEYLVNEIQCFFGQSDPYQMLVDETPGRYVYNNDWDFEKGNFNANESFNLRIKHVLELLERQQG